MGLVPRSEMAAISIMGKLEGLGAIPFSYGALEFATNEGIDALCDLKLSEMDPLDVCAPVEYELSFENFLTHGHPVELVKLIVCWDLNPDAIYIEATERPWLYRYRDKSHSIPVAVMSLFPDIHIE